MCGLAGYLAASVEQPETMRTQVLGMADAIAYRGPDRRDHWLDPDARIAFAHLRLAIVDLTEAGAQPMTSSSGRFVTVYNGEIYNHGDLRARIEAENRAPRWRGHSDTETLLAGIDSWGIEETLRRSIGMFALAVWDRERQVLTLARDRLGEKPLYYGWQGTGTGRVLLFGSELGALRSHPACEARIRRDVLPEFLRHGHIAEDRSIYEGIAKVRPGEIVEISLQAPEPARRYYWSGADIAVARGGPDAPRYATPDAAIAELEELLSDAVGRQMMSDVPLGAFLSGGIDSSVVVAMMQRHSPRPVHTFSIGFHEARYNEAEHAAAVAAHLGTDHTELYIDEATLLSVVPKLPRIYGEPHADSSQIPTYLVAKLARKQVTVALSGDGGDEIFGGYDRYGRGAELLKTFGRLPGPLRRLGAASVKALPARLLNGMLEPLMPTPQGKEPNGQRLHRLAEYLQSGGTDSLHRKLVSRWQHPQRAVPGTVPCPTNLDAMAPPRGDLDDIERMMQLDMLNYLPDDILAKVDRATMAVSLESRAPLLDHRIVEFAWSLPRSLRCRSGASKWVLRQVLYRHVPPELIDRPKMGFEVPIGLWLRGPLRDWAEEMLAPGRLAEFFDPPFVRRYWADHLAGHANHGMRLWPVLMFEAWRRG